MTLKKRDHAPPQVIGTQPKQKTNLELQAEIDELRGMLRQINQRLPDDVAAHRPHIPMWALIREYLLDNGGKASPKQIAESLDAAGHNLGRYPLRNVKITVMSPVLKSVFRVTANATGEETVHLIDKALPYSSRYGKKGRA